MRPYVDAKATAKRYWYVPYIGLYLFGIGAILLNLLEFAGTIQCSTFLNMYSDTLRNKTIQEQITDRSSDLDASTSLNIFKAVAVFLQVFIYITDKVLRFVSNVIDD